MSSVAAIDLHDLVGAFDDVAQLDACAKEILETFGIHFVHVESDEAGPVRAAAVQLGTGEQYLLVEHFAHPKKFIDVRARVDLYTSLRAVQTFLAAVTLLDPFVDWTRPEW